MGAQMKQASDAGLFFPALVLALTLPDICSALASENGRSSGSKYRQWIREWVYPDWSDDFPEKLWDYRCALLHQGRSTQGKSGSFPIAFIVPDPNRPRLHNITTSFGADEVTWCDVTSLVNDVGRAVGTWLSAHGRSSLVRRNLERSIHLRAKGIPPHLDGVPVVM